MVNTYKDDPIKGLSGLQVNILRQIVDRYDLEWWQPGFSEMWGVLWNPSNPSGDDDENLIVQTRSEAVCYSRALARLEKRGLILRQNRDWRRRTTVADRLIGKTSHVVVTDLGFVIASRLRENG